MKVYPANIQNGRPAQLDEKQVQYILKETGDQFFYYLFRKLENGYKGKIESQEYQCTSKGQFKTIVETLKADDILLEKLYEQYDTIFERG
ncbi:hypothetical protein HYR99_27260 [Candidatus Poribacteria bacterium]|nr:hypothetical protein [Candidatus Poribacteria bacterium]